MDYCSELNNVLTFFPREIRSCCVLGKVGPIYFRNFGSNFKDIDFETFKQKKREFFLQLESGLYTKLTCYDCIYKREKTEKDVYSEQFSLVYLNHWTHCNCGCFYCDRMLYSARKITPQKQKSEFYDILPIMKGLYEHNLLDRKNLRVVFHGGDLSVLKEFEPLVKLFMKEGIRKIDFSSNNIIYQPIIAKCLRNNIASLNMSIDAGTRETYKKIKRVDKFNNVVKNLRKYVKESKAKNPEINVKFIILKGMNDKESEIRNFIDLMVDIGIKRVSLHLEHKYAVDLLSKKTPLPGKYKSLINLFFDLCKQNQLLFDTPDDVMNQIIQGTS